MWPMIARLGPKAASTSVVPMPCSCVLATPASRMAALASSVPACSARRTARGLAVGPAWASQRPKLACSKAMAMPLATSPPL
jgi:hypothetical protein